MVDLVFLALVCGVPNVRLCDVTEPYSEDCESFDSIETKSTIEYDSILRRGDRGLSVLVLFSTIVLPSDIDLVVLCEYLELFFLPLSSTFCTIKLPRKDFLALGDSGVNVLFS